MTRACVKILTRCKLTEGVGDVGCPDEDIRDINILWKHVRELVTQKHLLTLSVTCITNRCLEFICVYFEGLGSVALNIPHINKLLIVASFFSLATADSNPNILPEMPY